MSSPEAAVVPSILETFPSELRFTRDSLQHELSVVYVRQAPSTPGTMNMTTRFIKFDVRTTSPRLFTVKGGRRRAIQVKDAATVLIRAKAAEGALTAQQRQTVRLDPNAVVSGRFLVSYEYISEEQYLEASRGWKSLVRGEGLHGNGPTGSSPSMAWKGRNFDMLASGSIVVPWVLDLRPDAPLVQPIHPGAQGPSAQRLLESSASSTDLHNSSSEAAEKGPMGCRGVLLEHLQDEVNIVRTLLTEVELESMMLLRERRQLQQTQKAILEAEVTKANTSRQRLWRMVDSIAWVEVAAVALMMCSTALLALNI